MVILYETQHLASKGFLAGFTEMEVDVKDGVSDFLDKGWLCCVFPWGKSCDFILHRHSFPRTAAHRKNIPYPAAWRSVHL